MKCIIIVMVLAMSSIAEAGMFFCGSTTGMVWYRQSVDPTRLQPCDPPAATSEVKDSAVAVAQHALVESVGLKYLRVSGVAPNGVMIEVTTEERAAIDLPKQQKDAALAVANSEIQNNQICANNTLEEISQHWKGTGGKSSQLQTTIQTLDTAIGVLSAGPVKEAFQAVRASIVAHMNMFIDDGEMQWRYQCARTFVRP